MALPQALPPEHSPATPRAAALYALRRGFARALSLSACLLGGVAFAQVPGPVNLTGSGGAESDYTSSGVGGGGSVTTFGAYTLHIFTKNGMFVPPEGLTQVDVLVVGGGGSGGGDREGGGGGGAGDVVWQTNVGVSGFTTVAIGDGGAASTTTGNNGSQSSFGAVTAAGGGGGGRGETSANGAAGASGGGGGGTDSNGTTRTGGTGSGVNGFNGGSGTSTTGDDNDVRGGDRKSVV